MSKISINIIGGGIGGLFSGALLSKHGFDVKVFEARSKPGGFATSWKRGDYLFDSSLHEINGFYPDDKKLRSFRYLKLFDRINLIKIPSPYTSVFNDYEFKIPHDYELYREKLVTEFPDEKNNINKVLDMIKNISIEASLFMNEKSKMTAYKNTPIKYRNIMKNLLKTVYDTIWKNIRNPKVRTIIAQLYLYYSDDIKKLSMIYFSPPTFAYINQSFWISGTSASLTKALCDIIAENGGVVMTGKKVDRVVFDGKKAAGIIVNGTEEYRSDITICNSPIKHTAEKIIGLKKIPLHLRFIASRSTPSTSIFSLYLGMKIDIRNIGFNEYCYMLNEVDDLHINPENEDVPGYEIRPLVIVGYNLDGSLCPEKKTVVNISITDRAEYWNEFKNDGIKYRNEKERIAKIILSRVEKKFPGFSSYIEEMEIGTPVTMERYTGNPEGAVYGASQRISQSNIFRFPNEIKKRNLYFSGAWVTPGGGLSGVIISAINVAELILKRCGLNNGMEDHIHPIPEVDDQLIN